MGAISQTNINFMGSHCGTSIGEDGASQMALEDLAMFRAIPGSTVFYPADAVSTERAVELAANTPGITFLRINRPTTKVIYSNDHQFQVCSLASTQLLNLSLTLISGWKIELNSVVQQRPSTLYWWWYHPSGRNYSRRTIG